MQHLLGLTILAMRQSPRLFFFFLTKNTTTHLTILALIDERTDLSLLVPVARAARPILLDLLFHSTKAQPFTVNRGS